MMYFKRCEREGIAIKDLRKQKMLWQQTQWKNYCQQFYLGDGMGSFPVDLAAEQPSAFQHLLLPLHDLPLFQDSSNIP